MLIVDVDAHHYENENYRRDPALHGKRRAAASCRSAQAMKGGRGIRCRRQIGYQDMGGRVTRYPMRSSRRPRTARHRDVQLGHRWMDAMSVDYSCLFPTGMLNIGLHPQKEMEVDLCWAYNRWLTEKVLPEAGGRMFSMLCLPFSDPGRGAAPGRDFRRPQARRRLHGDDGAPHLPVHDNAYMKVYRAMEERGLVLSFHSGVELGRADLRELQPFHRGARARLLLLQYPALHQLGGQRHGRALPQAAGDLDRSPGSPGCRS